MKRCSNKECCKQCRYVMFKGTMTKWPVQKLAQGTTQKWSSRIMDCVLFTFENTVTLMRLGRQWCGIFPNHWQIASINPWLLFSPCKLCVHASWGFFLLFHIDLYHCKHNIHYSNMFSTLHRYTFLPMFGTVNDFYCGLNRVLSNIANLILHLLEKKKKI